MSAVEPTVRPHPRIRERRVAVRREAGRRRLRLVIGLAAVAASVGASWGLTRSPLLDVDTIEVTGAIHTDPQVLLRAAGVHQGRAMVDLDPPAAAADVERLPWVAEATIVRKWPATVEVRLTERVAVAVVRAADDAWALTDATGRVLAVVAEPPEGLTAVDLVVDTVPRAGGSLDARGRG
ncbi:MAG: cell division protein FtsQ/DivIB, partial [Acidimicrobiales bacterium]